MTAGTETRYPLMYRRLMAHLRTPLFRNGYALTLSSLGSSLIGMLYWVIAAHKYPPGIVGINSAVISAMMFVAGVAELNLMSALIRFIPTLGRSTKRFVLVCYLAALSVSVIISYIFLVQLPAWSPALQFLGTDTKLAGWFIVSTAAWCIFVLQDSVLTGLRQATWVPVENIVYSLVKIVLMIVFAEMIPALGIFASWSIALIVSIVPTNFYIFFKMIPAHESMELKQEVVEPRQIIRFAAADYVGALAWLVSINLMPVIVTTVAGGAANAYFFLSWTIAYALYLVPNSMGSSLVVETAADPQSLGRTSRRVFINVLQMIVPAAAIAAVGAPIILRVFGRSYSTEASTLLRLLALSAIPFTINAVFVSVARTQRRVRAVAATLAPLSMTALILGYLLLRAVGIVGIGISWIVAQTIVAFIVYFTQLLPLWRADNIVTESSLLPAHHRDKLNLLHILYRVMRQTGLFAIARNFLAFFISQRTIYWTSHFLEDLAQNYSLEMDSTRLDMLGVRKLASTTTGKTVAFLAQPSEPPSLVLKISGNQPTAESLISHWSNLEVLSTLQCLGEWRDLLPVVISKGVHAEQLYIIERTLPGVCASEVIRNDDSRRAVVNRAITAIGYLHRQTALLKAIDDETWQKTIGRPLATMQDLFSSSKADILKQQTISRLGEELYNDMIGKHLLTSWTHGDFAPTNVLIDPESHSITGIVDWELARQDGFPQLDRMHWIISTRMAVQEKEMGMVICDLLSMQNWTPEELYIINPTSTGMSGDRISLRSWLLLAWLQHIFANLTKSDHFTARHPIWAVANILPVLQYLDNGRN